MPGSACGYYRIAGCGGLMRWSSESTCDRLTGRHHWSPRSPQRRTECRLHQWRAGSNRIRMPGRVLDSVCSMYSKPGLRQGWDGGRGEPSLTHSFGCCRRWNRSCQPRRIADSSWAVRLPGIPSALRRALASDCAFVMPIARNDFRFDRFQLALKGSFSLIRRERQRMWSYAPALGSAMANALPRVHARRASSVSPRSHMMDARAIQ